jgi:hypothetical protein
MSKGLRWTRKWSLFIVPLAYLAAILLLQPSDNLRDSFVPGRAVYDDYDVTAYALRGLNASLGRTAGRMDEPAKEDHFQPGLPSTIDALESRYFLEYPHAALLIFRLGYWLPTSAKELPIFPAVCDGNHGNIVEYEPQTDLERFLWKEFRQVTRVHVILMIGCLLTLMTILRRGYEPGGRLSGPLWLLLLPATLYFSANRFDIVPALLMAASLACLGRDRVIVSAIFLGVGTMVKLYPCLIFPLVIRYLSGNWKAAAMWSLSYGATLLAFLAPTVWQSGVEATLAPYRYQLERDLEPLTFYGTILPKCLGGRTGWGPAFRLGSLLLTFLCLTWARIPDLETLLRRAALVLAVFVSLQVFYSPQWIVWFAPLLTPLAARYRPILVLAVALDLVTYATFPLVFDWAVSFQGEMFTALVILRGLVLAALAFALVRCSRRVDQVNA